MLAQDGNSVDEEERGEMLGRGESHGVSWPLSLLGDTETGEDPSSVCGGWPCPASLAGD